MTVLKNPALLRTQSYINGQWISVEKTFPVLNPYDGSVIANVANVGVHEAKQAIEAAHKAGLEWRNVPLQQRIDFLLRWAEQVKMNTADLTLLLTLEQGKPLAQANNEIT